jgi:hypothetical protein
VALDADGVFLAGSYVAPEEVSASIKENKADIEKLVSFSQIFSLTNLHLLCSVFANNADIDCRSLMLC